MAGRKQFDRDAALDRAMSLFWERGYAASSVQDLVQRTGVNRQSLYDTFGDKHDLFLQALERYRQLGARQFRSLLAGDAPIRDRFARFFEHYLDDAATDDRCRGCFLVNSTLELGGRDPDTILLLCRNLDSSESLFERALAEAKGRGELAESSDPRKLARFLYSSLTGLRVIGKTSPERGRLRDIVEITLAAIH